MGRLGVSSEALKQGRIVELGWYRCLIVSQEQANAKDGQSRNQFVNFRIVTGPFTMTNLRICFNEKGLDPKIGAPGAKIFAEFGKALGMEVDVEKGVVIEFDGVENKMINVHAGPSKDDKGNTINSIDGFKPAEQDAPSIPSV